MDASTGSATMMESRAAAPMAEYPSDRPAHVEEIPLSMDRLASAISQLEAITEALSIKLSIALAPDPGIVAEVAKRPERQTQIGDYLSHQESRVETVVSVIAGLERRLGL